jgi:hypothetical protein
MTLRHLPRDAAREIHLLPCDCDLCEAIAPPPPRFVDEGAWLAKHALAGVALGLALSWVLDRLFAGPGLLASFGL